MKAERLFDMFAGRDPDAEVFVNVEGTNIAVVSARYDPRSPGSGPKVVLGLDRLQVLLLLEKLKNRTEEEQ